MLQPCTSIVKCEDATMSTRRRRRQQVEDVRMAVNSHGASLVYAAFCAVDSFAVKLSPVETCTPSGVSSTGGALASLIREAGTIMG